jgi:hypothetical protein
MTVKADGGRAGGFRGRAPGRVARAAASWAAGVALLAGTRGAFAHPEFSALGTNRYVTAAVFDGRVDVTDALLEGALASGEERRRLDTDGDGRIGESELRAGQERLRAQGPAIVVEIDGRPLGAPLEVTIDLGDDTRAETAPLVIERRLSFPGAWTSGPHRLRVALTREPPRVLDTEIGVVLGPGLVLRGGPDREVFRGPRVSDLQERAATFVLAATTDGGARPGARARRVWFAACLALVALAVALGATVARRRSTRA